MKANESEETQREVEEEVAARRMTEKDEEGERHGE